MIRIVWQRKPFLAKVRWSQVWHHRWMILDLMNQIARGTRQDALALGRLYGSGDEWGGSLYTISRDIMMLSKRER